MAVEGVMGYTRVIDLVIDLEFGLGYAQAKSPQPGWKWAISAVA